MQIRYSLRDPVTDLLNNRKHIITGVDRYSAAADLSNMFSCMNNISNLAL
jgi:hypothetical protein